MKMCLFWVFLHAKFISALKTEPKPMVFEKHAKNGKKINYFLFFVIFFKSLKQKCLFSANPIKCAYLGIFACRIHFCTENRAKFYDF